MPVPMCGTCVCVCVREERERLLNVLVCVSVFVCVCERERKRERERTLFRTKETFVALKKHQILSCPSGLSVSLLSMMHGKSGV